MMRLLNGKHAGIVRVTIVLSILLATPFVYIMCDRAGLVNDDTIEGLIISGAMIIGGLVWIVVGASFLLASGGFILDWITEGFERSKKL